MKKTITLIAASLLSFCVNAQWDTLHTPTATDFNSISFSTETNGVAVGKDPVTLQGAAYYTTDGGLSWSLVSSGTPSYNDVFFQSSNRAWIAADSGYILETSNYGQSFGTWAHIGAQNFNCIMFPSDTVGYVGGNNGALYRTPDFGITWDTLQSNTTLPIRDIYFMNELIGWFVADGGYIASTIDGGQTWTTIPQPALGFFQCKGIAFAGTSLNPVVVGDDGIEMYSNDAGANWTQLFFTGYDLNCVRFGNALAGIICGDHGVIQRTYVGGPNWADESLSYVTENLTKVCFASDTLAYICGENGRILKSTSDISSVPSHASFSMNAAAYPNPFQNELHLVLNLEKATAIQITVLDLAGRIVLEQNFTETTQGENRISIENASFTSGMYLVRVTTENNSAILPVIRQ
jgi:photosystem II stability/assembly factor-like uncharacterized protein